MPLGMLLLLFCQRQRKDKLRTNAFRADTVDVFAVCLDNLLYDGETKPGSFFVLAAGEIRLVEALPDFRDACLWNAAAGVLDGDEDLVVLLCGLDCDCGVRVAEFDCIVDQVVEYLLDLTHIGGDKKLLAG